MAAFSFMTRQNATFECQRTKPSYETHGIKAIDGDSAVIRRHGT